MARYCPNCGAKQSDGAKFCLDCGTPLDPEQDKTTVSQEARKEEPTRMSMSGNSAGGFFSRKLSKQRYLAIGAIALVLIGAAGFYVGRHDTAKEAASSAADTADKMQSAKGSELSLGGLEVGITLDEMHSRMGKESSKHQDGKITYYYYDGIIVGVVSNKVIYLGTNEERFETKRGIHKGMKLDEVLRAYGDSYQQKPGEGKMNYDYTFNVADGKKGVLRFTVNPRTNVVDYISARIPDEDTSASASTDKQNQDVTEILYTGGKTSPLKLTKNQIQLRVGERVLLKEGDNSGDAGMLRLMTKGGPGGSSGECVKVKGTGKQGAKGSNTSMLITAQKPGEVVFTVVPNYGSWDNATKLYIKVVK